MALRRTVLTKTLLIALVASVLALAPVAQATDRATETHAYYSVVHNVPYAPYTDLRATSIVPYYSVLHDVPYAPYTDLGTESLVPYFSVVHEPY